jgi:secreted trypsin-like serine protease
MRPTLSLAFVFLTACVTVSEGEVEQAIVGGQNANAADFPTVVALMNNNGWFCTGVFVDKDWVLTSNFCFQGTGTQNLRVRFDDANVNDGGGITVNVAELHQHPSFNANSSIWAHDVALLKLATSVTDRLPTPIERTAMATATSVTLAGFGVNNNNGNGGGVLRSLATASIDCAQANDAGITNTYDLCFDASDGNGGCFGDGGAPIFIGAAGNRRVTGIGSGGTTQSCTSGFDIYTSLFAELQFIDTFVPHTDPTPPPPPPPPPGGGSGDPPADDPRGSHEGGGGPRFHTGSGCNASGTGNASWLLGLGLVGFALRRKRLR